MKMSAWSKVASIGLFGSLLVVGCVVGEGDDDGTGGSGGAGGSGTGGKGSSTGGTGGSSTGGKGGTGGGSGTGGSSGTGGGGPQCDPASGGPVGTPAADCEPVTPGDTCQECTKTSCCQEWKDCLRESPDNVCAWGGPADEGEIICFQLCVQAAVADGGVANDETQGECAGACGTPGCGTIGDQTNDMIACIADNCLAPCLQN